MESNTTVRAGMLTPMAKVSVAKRSYKKADSFSQNTQTFLYLDEYREV
jgi:predicted RNA polymerase sigma factor